MKVYDTILKKPWPYWVGGILLGVLNVILLLETKTSWGISTGFLGWGVYILEKFGFDPSKWHYFVMNRNTFEIGETFVKNHYTILILAMILGSLISTLLASEFNWKRIKNKKQLFFGLLGGILMGYGARLSHGCNIGAYFSAIPSFSLHGWIFGIFMFVGAWIGCKILLKFIL
ncbi:YeeE/YedE family protein [Crassaminicella thermophila]|uniref:YeeE/YedE family protein n=1 Tax=Crassaminicella thermophila TaxID=2599308 RepID=A0A5C0SJ61_CRATE|nr:YeeE/YedE thiosulfate transporter family protein [Crassaminicella thermophila]QEK12989.1 YeeE/YedE family protein [Crassaminicella thermophila]